MHIHAEVEPQAAREDLLDGLASASVLFSAVGAAAGLLLQQAIDVWRTKAVHTQELKRRVFEVKLQAAIDLAKSLDALVATYQARLAEAVERTRDDENFGGLTTARDVVDIQQKALERDYDQYVAAYAVLELVFSRDVVAALEGGVAVELANVWRSFDDAWIQLERSLEQMLPDARMAELGRQREAALFDERAHDEIARWMSVYKSGAAKARVFLPRIGELTLRAEQHRRKVLLAIRDEMKPYQV